MTAGTDAAPTYRVRFEFLVSPFFNADTRELQFDLQGLPAILKSVADRPLKEAQAVAIQVGHFSDEASAFEFGYRLQRATTLAAIKSDLGVNIGDNEVRTWVSDEVRRAHFAKTGTQLRNRVHGVDVFKEGVEYRFPVFEGRASVSIEPRLFLDELGAAYPALSKPFSPKLQHALRLRCEARLGGDGLGLTILAIASVEALTPQETWTAKQKEILDAMSTCAASSKDAAVSDIEEVLEAISKLRKLSVNQGIRRLLHRLNLQYLWPRWNALYQNRSKVLHGDVSPNVARSSLTEALALSKEIVLAAAARETQDAQVVE